MAAIKAQSTRKDHNLLSRIIPMVQWLPQYERGWLRFDLIAGLTVAALIIPKALGDAGIASVPIHYGLYAALAGVILYAIFGTSRQISTGPSSALAAVAGSAVVMTGLAGHAEAVNLVAAITFVTGVLFLLLALFKMGWISQFLSKAVITGFLFGAAIEVVIGELPKLTGTSTEGANSWQKLFSWLGSLSETDGTTLLVGLISVIVIFGLRRVAPKIPGALVLVVAGIPESTQVHGVTQSPMEGTSHLYSFNDADAPEQHQTQYFEVSGNRGIYHKGWSAVTPHLASWRAHLEQGTFDEDIWELYGPDDLRQAHDRATEIPEELERLKRLLLIEAVKFNVLPMDDRLERLNADLAGRPQLVRGNSQLLFGGMGRLNESAVISIKNKSHSVTANLQVPDSGADGVIVAQGGMFGGWSLYAKEGKLKYCYNLLGHKTWFAESEGPIPAGAHQVRMEFTYDGGGIGKGGLATLFIDGERVGAGRVDETHMMAFSGDETCDVGREFGSPVSPDYGPRGNEFSGEVNWVQIDLGLDDQSHLITPEQRLSFAMARQ